MVEKKTTVLIVEDERIVAEDIKRSVSRAGYTVCGVVSSGETALRTVESELPDLVLMDIILQGDMSGIETAEAIRARYDVPVIYLTAYADSHTLKKAKVTEPFGYILKPFEDRELESTLEMALYKYRIDKKLRESEERYRTLFEDSRDAIFMTTRDGKLVVANRSALMMLGYTEEEIRDVSVPDLFVDPDEGEHLQREIERNGSVRDFEVRLRSKHGRALDCMVTAALRRDKDGTVAGYHGIIHDFTERKRAEEEKEKIQAQLIQAQKMEAVGILAGGIAHDFNNLLTVIQGNSELALLQVDEDMPGNRELKEIRSASERAANLTSQLLLFSRKQPMRFVSTDLNKTVEDLLKMLHRLIGEDISIGTDLEEALWTVKADRGTMEQVIMNLSINARDAMPEGGRLTIQSRNATFDENAAGKGAKARPGQFVCLSVTDTGTGMDEELLSHIFEPFFSTKGPGRGTGLGLSVVFGIVEQHGGWIDVSSEPGQGTAFHVYLPAQPAKLEEEERVSVASEELMGHGEDILLVEDEEGVRMLAGTMLSKAGYNVHEAMDAAEAFKLFRKYKKKIALVLADVVLPDKSGIEIVGSMHVEKPGLRVLLSSGYTGWKAQWPVIQEKGYDFLQKPYSVHQLLSTVKEVLKRG